MLSWEHTSSNQDFRRLLEFAPVVALDALRYYTAQRFDSFHHRHHIDPFQILAHLALQTFATIVID